MSQIFYKVSYRSTNRSTLKIRLNKIHPTRYFAFQGWKFNKIISNSKLMK